MSYIIEVSIFCVFHNKNRKWERHVYFVIWLTGEKYGN